VNDERVAQGTVNCAILLVALHFFYSAWCSRLRGSHEGDSEVGLTGDPGHYGLSAGCLAEDPLGLGQALVIGVSDVRIQPDTLNAFGRSEGDLLIDQRIAALIYHLDDDWFRQRGAGGSALVITLELRESGRAGFDRQKDVGPTTLGQSNDSAEEDATSAKTEELVHKA
jgi:hypothetical protein